MPEDRPKEKRYGFVLFNKFSNIPKDINCVMKYILELTQFYYKEYNGNHVLLL